MISNTLVANNFSAGGWINCRIRAAQRSSTTAAAGSIVRAGEPPRSSANSRQSPVITQLQRDLGDGLTLTLQRQNSVHVLLLGHHAGSSSSPFRCLVARKAGGAVSPAGGWSAQEEQQNPLNREIC